MSTVTTAAATLSFFANIPGALSGVASMVSKENITAQIESYKDNTVTNDIPGRDLSDFIDNSRPSAFSGKIEGCYFSKLTCIDGTHFKACDFTDVVALLAYLKPTADEDKSK